MLNEYQIFLYIVIYDDTFSLDAASCACIAAASLAARLRFRQAAMYMVGVIGKIPDKPLR